MAEMGGGGMDPAGVQALITAALTPVQASIPTMATAAPPGVTDSSTAGVTSNQFAGPTHTHASKARKEIKAISATGLYTWTFPTAFGSGVVPICNAIAICPSGTTDLINVQQEGDATNTQVTFRVTRYQQSVVALISLTVLSVNASLPANIKLSMLALEP
jgi:hypothetical protein